MKNTKNAFTLAEVLITLAIIGVVAALIIPTLISNISKDQYLNSLKKFYSIANQALLQTALDEGTPGKIGANDTNTLINDIAANFKKIKDCGTSTTGSCFPVYNTYYDGNGSNVNQNTAPGYKFIMPDGMSVFLNITSADCSTIHNADSNSPMNKYCGSLRVDVNGLKPPNRAGRDVFIFHITSNKMPLLYPDGGKEFASNYWNTGGYCQSSNADGRFCTGRIIEENWQMNY